MVKSRRRASCAGSVSKWTASGRRPSLYSRSLERGYFDLVEYVPHQHYTEMRADAAGVRKQIHDPVGRASVATS